MACARSMKLSNNVVKALLSVIPKKDPRIYLAGAYIDPAGFVVATNGHVMLIVPNENPEKEDFIIPRNVLDIAAKTTLPTLEFTESEAGIECMGQQFSRVDVSFVDWRRVIPRCGELEAPGVANIAVGYLELAGKIGVLLGGKNNTMQLHAQKKEKAILVTYSENPGVLFMIMPIRDSDGEESLAAALRAINTEESSS